MTPLDDPRLPSSFVVVDAGARGGFSLLPRLRSRLDVHAFEPDEAACDELSLVRGLQSLRVWRLALGRRREQRTLHLTRRPSMSSLLPPDRDAYARHFGRMASYPAWVRNIEPVRQVEVPTIGLDEWTGEAGVSLIHLLKLDTQGTELDVLQGAAALLAAGRILVVYTEVSFLPVYQGQALFPAVDRFPTDAGLALIDCRFHPRPSGGQPWRRGYVEPPRWGAGGDATYACLPDRWPAGERADRTVATAALLSQLGYGRTAAAWLRRFAGWSIDEVHATLNAWTHRSPGERARSWVRRWVPPALARG